MPTVIPEVYNLSPQQKSIWRQRDRASLPRVQLACTISGNLDKPRLDRAIRQVISRHEIFRTRLVALPELKYPVQEVLPEIGWNETEPVGLSSTTAQIDLKRILIEEMGAGSNGKDASQLPLRITIFTTQPAALVLVISAAGVYADAVTLQTFVREVNREYSSSVDDFADSDLPLQYVEYASWREEMSSSSDELAVQGKAYWRQLAGSAVQRPSLAGHRSVAQHTSESTQMGHLCFIPLRLGDNVAKRLIHNDAHDGDALRTGLLACWGLFLATQTQFQKLEIGCVVDGRQYEEFQKSMGPYAQAVPVHFCFSPATTYAEAYAHAHDLLHQALLWQDYWVTPETRDDGLAGDLFGFAFLPDAGDLDENWKVQTQRTTTYPFDLKLECFRDNVDVAGSLVYRSPCISPPLAELLAERFTAFCESVSARPSTPISRIDTISAADRYRLLSEWNKNKNAGGLGSGAQNIIQLLSEQVADTPHARAVVCGDTQLTFKELWDRASSFAVVLRKAGVEPDVPVCLLLERSVDMVAAIIAVWRAGGAYVPLDSAYPVKERIIDAVRETKAPLMLTQHRFREYVEGAAATCICIEDIQPKAEPEPFTEPALSADNLAYIIYTSGSTGKPKGVMVQHGSVLNLWSALTREIYGDSQRTLRVTLNAPTAFDASVKQLLMLTGGHELHVMPTEVRLNPHTFVQYIREQKIDVLDCTPSHLNTLLEADLIDDPDSSLSIALIGGEAVTESMWQRLAGCVRTRFWNVYGPTECTVDSMVQRIRAGSQPSIGRPLPNTTVYVLDESAQLVAPGSAGELCIGGAGLARGYWGTADVTAQRFIPDPFSAIAGKRLYRTGDLVRHLPDGEIEYLGRIDQQVKVRGFRVEPGEIAAALSAHPEVREAVIHAFKDLDNTRLVAYFVPAGQKIPTENTLKEFLDSQLPNYMIPSAFVSLDGFPINANGKLNRAALIDPSAKEVAARSDYVAPATKVEVVLAEIWSSVLNRDHIGTRDNFFDLGGHSLLAMRMIGKVRKEFAVGIPLPRLFHLPTIEALGKVIEEYMTQESFKSGLLVGETA